MDPTTDFLGGFGSFAVVLVKSTAIMALAFLAARLLRHASGTVRHRV